VSKTTVYEIVHVMKMMGAEIEYCPSRKSFVYLKDKVLALGFVEPKKISGGKNLNNFSQCPVFSDNYVFTLNYIID